MSDTGGFILVHGGEHGPWCWDTVIPRLRWPAVAVGLPGRDAKAGDPIRFGLADNARALVDAVTSSAFDPCIVVSHSLGGLTVLAAEPRYPTPPHHRVFVSAVTPSPGTTGLDALPALFRAYLKVRLRAALRRGAVIHLLPRWLAGVIWFHDLEKDQRTQTARALCAESPTIALEPTPRTSPPPGEMTYVVLTKDRAIRPRTQRGMARNLGIHDVRHLDAAHEAMLSHPDLLASELDRIAAAVSARRSNTRPEQP